MWPRYAIQSPSLLTAPVSQLAGTKHVQRVETMRMDLALISGM